MLVRLQHWVDNALVGLFGVRASNIKKNDGGEMVVFSSCVLRSLE